MNRYFAAALCLVVLVAASFMPDGLKSALSITHNHVALHAVAHVLSFACLGVSLARCVTTDKARLAVFLLITASAAILEAMEIAKYPQQPIEIGDILWDSLGALIGCAGIAMIARRTYTGIIPKSLRNKNYTVLAAHLTGSLPSPPPADENFFAAATSQAILPTLVPEVTALNRERNAHILAEAKEIISALNQSGIEPVVLKGLAYLITEIYPDPGQRYLIDLDFLIPESQLAAAIQVLSAAGYHPDTQDAVARFRHHAPAMWRPGSAPVELHHCLGLGVSSRILPAAAVLSAASSIEWQGVRVRIPSPEHLATHLILHSQIQHPYVERIWPPLRALYDLLLLNRHLSINWFHVERLFAAAGQGTVFRLHLLQAQRTMGMPLPVPVVLSPIAKLRWARRRLLHRWPALRLCDPVYLPLSAFTRRLRLLRSILSTPGGWKAALRTLVNPGFYQRLFADITL